MRRILLIITILIIIISIMFFVMASMFSEPNIEDRYQYACKLIEKEYNILLEPEEIVSFKDAISRDYACAVAFRLTDSHKLDLREMILKDETWIKANYDIVNTYIMNFVSFDEILLDIKELCDDSDTYIKVIVWENNMYVNRFSIMAVNIRQDELYYFTWN